MTAVRHGALLVPLVLACGQAEEASSRDAGVTFPENKSGKRIKYLRWTSPDGTGGPMEIRDSQLGIECSWMRVAQDQFRCVPRDRQLYYPVRHSDPECRQPVYTFERLRTCDEPPAYLIRPLSALTCPASYQLSKRGLMLPERAYYKRLESGECAVEPVPLAANEELYAYGDPAPMTDFVAGTLRAGVAKNDFALTYLDGEDGSSMHFAFRDLGGEFDCQRGTAADGEQRCLPLPLAWGDVFVDDACLVPAAAGVKTSCERSKGFLWKTEERACGPRQFVFRLGARLSSGFHDFAEGCDTSTGSPYLHYFDIGDEVDSDTLAPIGRSFPDRGKRVRPYSVVTPAGSYPGWSLRDAQLGIDCSIYLLADGTYRCAPDLLGVDMDLFADDQCSIPVAVTASADCPDTHAFRSVPEACPEQLRILTLKPEMHDGPVYLLRDGTCKMARVVTQTGDPAVFQLIEGELDPAAMVEFRKP